MFTPTLTEAHQIILDATTPLASETVALDDALGRVLFEPVRATTPIPPFHTSRMDGFAVHTEDLRTASADNPVALEVVGYIGAGSVFRGTAGRGQCIRIMTGAPVPPEFDGVIKVEDTTTLAGDGMVGSTISYAMPVIPQENIRSMGYEAELGDELLAQGQIINPYCIGALASAGATTVEVYKRPKVAVIPIGSEIVSVGTPLTPGMIKNSSYHAVCAFAKEAGARVIPQAIVPDDPARIKRALIRAASQADVVITLGGSSRGDFDFIDQCVEETGTLHFEATALHPLKTQGFGVVEDALVFSMPGMPGAAFVGFELFARPALMKLSGHTQYFRPSLTARLAQDMTRGGKQPDLPLYLRGLITLDEHNQPQVSVPPKGKANLFGAKTYTNCIFVLEDSYELRTAGTPVTCWLV